MNGRLDKVAMTNKLMQLKRELHYKCEIGEKGEWECKGANDYLNRVFDVLAVRINGNEKDLSHGH